jgi:hypothetical protein
MLYFLFLQEQIKDIIISVPRLHLPVAPGISSGKALAGLDLGLYVRRKFRSRGAFTAGGPRVPASVILARPLLIKTVKPYTFY